MRALLLEDVRRFSLRQCPEPAFESREILIRVRAVGVCGTDFHIYSGAANYNVDVDGRPVPLSLQPQILGHEFCGEVVVAGSEVDGLRRGDRVVLDQGMNCFSRGRYPACEYCAAGHSHQCVGYQERGITGLPGALREFVNMPAVNAVPLGDNLSFEEAALVEPLGTVIHAMDRAERADARFSLSPEQTGRFPVENVLVLGAGPAGQLFVQYIRNVKKFEGQLLVADVVEKKLDLAGRFGAAPINIRSEDLVSAVRRLTPDGKIHFLVEASGHGSAFETMPAVLKKQATVVLFGHGHQGTDLSVLNRLLFLEPTLIAPVGASGTLDPHTHRPTTYQRAEELIRTGLVRVSPLITHRYGDLEEVDAAFSRDSKHADYVKGVLSLE